MNFKFSLDRHYYGKKTMIDAILFESSFWKMDYKKKSLDKINCNNSYEEIDTRLASGWYVDAVGKNKKKKYKTKEVSFKISRKHKLVK